MALKWKRWIASLLLAFAATTAAASACAMTCIGAQAALAAPSSHCHDEGAPTGDACPLSQLCGFAFAPAAVPAAPQVDLTPAAYIPSLVGAVVAGIDQPPPIKPPQA